MKTIDGSGTRGTAAVEGQPQYFSNQLTECPSRMGLDVHDPNGQGQSGKGHIYPEEGRCAILQPLYLSPIPTLDTKGTWKWLGG